MESASDAIIVADEEGSILSWNAAATRMFGYRPEEAIGRPLTLIMPEAQRERQLATLVRATAGKKGTIPRGGVLEMEGLAKDGCAFPVEISLATWDEEERRYFAGFLRDVTERKAVEGELHLLASATDHVRDAIVVSTAGDSGRGPTILYANAAFVRMTGYSDADALGRSFSLLAGPKTDLSVLRAIHQRMRVGDPGAAELIAYRKDGTEFLLDWRTSPIYEPDGTVQHFASIQRNVTEERRAEHALRTADRDILTGLLNREVLERYLLRSIERVERRRDYRCALLFIDLDGFKIVNDEHGHMVGDQLLTSTARRLEGAVRPGDTVARFGGDEFVVLLEYVANPSDIIMVAHRVQECLRAPFDIQGRELTVAASIGVALSESGYEDPRDMIRDADEAMYSAKRKGKGRIEFFDRGVHGNTARGDFAHAQD